MSRVLVWFPQYAKLLFHNKDKSRTPFYLFDISHTSRSFLLDNTRRRLLSTLGSFLVPTAELESATSGI